MGQPYAMDIGEYMKDDAGHVPAVRNEAVIAAVRHTTVAIAAAQRGDQRAVNEAMSAVHQQRSNESRS